MVQSINGFSVQSVGSSKATDKSSERSSKPRERVNGSDSHDAVMAEVMRENQVSSKTRLEDIDAAIDRANSVGDSLKGHRDRAIAAHGGLDHQRVLELLRED